MPKDRPKVEGGGLAVVVPKEDLVWKVVGGCCGKQAVELFCGNEKHGPPAHLSNITYGEEEDDAEL